MELTAIQQQCLQTQLELAKGIEQKNSFSYQDIKQIAGIDLAYWKEEDKELAVCCLVVLQFPDGKVLERVHTKGEITFPYIPSYLAFRELPLILETVKKLKSQPDLYVFDGNGYLHPRHMGIATQASFSLKKPTIGVAKSYYKIGDTLYLEPGTEAGCYTDIVIQNEVWGRVLRTKSNVKPIFLSVGNYIDLDTATQIILSCIGEQGHIPLPTRLADIDTHEMRQYYQNLKLF